MASSGSIPKFVFTYSPATGRFHIQHALPISIGNGVLLFVGSIFYAEDVGTDQVDDAGDDAVSCLGLLSRRLSALANLEDIIGEIQRLCGPWAFVYYRSDLNKLFIGRDTLGRKSLLWSRRGDELVIAPSVADSKLSWSEIPSGTVSVLNGVDIWKDLLICSARPTLECLWLQQFTNMSFSELHKLREKFLTTNRAQVSLTKFRDDTEIFLEQFGGAVKRSLRGFDGSANSVAVLFSGGIDSLLVAVMVRRYVPSSCTIDLINVSFDDKGKDFGNAPDRRRGIRAFLHLKEKYAESAYRLLLVNVDRVELARCRTESIALAIAPSCSVLDDSIGCVQWFANRAKGVVFGATDDVGSPVSVRSEAALVLVGSGADELFGGYMRHRHTFMKDGRDAVLDELQEELAIIGERNLGRDDRVASSHNRDTRAPYLDDLFVEWANQLPLEVKADFSKRRGVGEKTMLRQALEALDVPDDLYSAPKQAMQFGTRIAHLENVNEKGSDVCSRLTSSHGGTFHLKQYSILESHTGFRKFHFSG